MAITTAQINGAITDPANRAILVAVNAATATAIDIGAAPVSLALKTQLLDLLNSASTRQNINAAAIDLPCKAVLLAAAGV